MNKVSRWVVVGISLCVGLLGLTACGNHQKPSATTASPKQTNLNFAVGPSIDALPVYVAETQGYFGAQHLRVNLTNVAQPADRVSGVNTGQFNGAISGLPEFMTTSGTSPTGKVVASATNYVAVMTTTDTVTKLTDLKHATVGTLANSTQAYALSELLDEQKVNAKTVAIKTAGSETELMTALTNQTAGAVTLTDPNASRSRRDGARTIAQTTAGQADTGIIFSQQMLTKHAAAVKAFITAYNQAVDYINAHPDTMSYQDVLVNSLGYPGDNLSALALPHFEHATTIKHSRVTAVRDWLLTTNSGLNLAPVNDYRSTILTTK
ncbi:ABC transporter substrate-binding protein [Furfurilactobacillus sp. WILCCON 0119]